jgi:hypothetical protein
MGPLNVNGIVRYENFQAVPISAPIDTEGIIFPERYTVRSALGIRS